METCDLVIVGGGIVGLATAYHFCQQHPDSQVILLEKEDDLAVHQTGHNSGVLHSGIYYRPGSLKAENCRQGRAAMVDFCREQGIEHDVCGKVIVAVSEDEVPTLERIYERGQQNEVRCELISAERLRELEPHAAGVRAIHVPDAGIVNYRQVCQRLGELIESAGAQIRRSTRVAKIVPRSDAVIVQTSQGELTAKRVVNCGGLYSDRLVGMSGQTPQAKIIPFRGEYYELKPSAHHLVRNLIYPVPDPSFPFLGVHFTRMIDGSVECGPNAVLALAREGYRWRDVNIRELGETLGYAGFWRLALKYWRTGAGEVVRSLSKRAFVKALQRLVPEITGDHIETAPAGVRAQAVSPQGAMIDDFMIESTQQIVHVVNAPSPAATSSLNIGRLVVEQLQQRSS